MNAGMKQRAAAILADPRWAVLVKRAGIQGGGFFYSVRTTGIYCRCGCSARLPKPEHVTFHASAAAAERAGFRACLRCQPNRAQTSVDKRAALMADLCRYIDALPERPRLADLAARAGMSPYHLHRLFKATLGITPAAYAAAQRARRMRHALDHSSNVTQAIYDAGFGSSSRFYEATAGRLGMTPSRYRKGGLGSEIRFAAGPCSLGHVLVAASDRGICAVLLGDDAHSLREELRTRFPQARLDAAGEDFARTLAAVVQLIDEPGRGFQLPLDIRGTAFQQRVWAALRAIPPGERMSYGALAGRIGQPRAVRAVARACAANALAVVVPCHRAVDAKGGLAGYRWGLARKQVLLEREGAPRRASARPDEGSKGRKRATKSARPRRRKRSVRVPAAAQRVDQIDGIGEVALPVAQEGKLADV